MKRLFTPLALCFMFLFGSAVSFGQVNYVSWDFTTSISSANYCSNLTNQNTARSSALSSPTLSTISLVGGATCVSANTFLRATGWPTTQDNNKYEEFSVTLGSGQTFQNISMSLAVSASVSSTTTAARNYQVRYGWGAAPTFADATNGTVSSLGTGASSNTATIPAPGNITTTKLTIRIVVFGTTSSTGNMQLQTVALTAAQAPLSGTSPTVTTTTATSITTTGATSGGNVTSDGGVAVTSRGVAYNTTPSPITSGPVVNDASGGTGTFTSVLSGLSVNTQYFYRAYAVNTIGTSYGSESNFYTLANAPSAPTLSNASATTIDVAVQPTDGNPSTTQYAIRENGSGNYVQANGTLGATAVWQTSGTWNTAKTVTGLNNSTSYTFSIKARNGANVETSFGSNASKATLSLVPAAPTVNGATSSTLNVAVNANGNNATAQFAIHETTTDQYVQADGSLGSTAVWQSASGWGTKTVTNLQPSTQYTFEVKARNPDNVETAFGATASGQTVSAAQPLITTGTLAGFGNVCTNTTTSAHTFTINGVNLTTDPISISSLAGFSYSTDDVTYSSSLSIAQPGGSFSQTVYVKFSPTAVQSYDGNIIVGGGGAPSVNVAATGSGINTASTVSTGSASSITLSSATLAGNITSTGCTAITAYGVEYSSLNNFTPGTGTQIPGNNLSGGAFSVNVTGLNNSSTYYYRAYAGDGTGTIYGLQSPFQTLTPTITTGALAAFGSVCTNTTAGPNSFTITGTNLTTADVTVAALNGYTYATTSNGTYASSLSIAQIGGSFSQTIFVKFSPTAAQSYSGNIVVGGGGASSSNVAASGTGINTPPVPVTGAASSITATGATVAATITQGCETINAYGVEYSTTSGFANGTGTQTAGSNLSGGAYSVALSGLAPNTTYYYKAYVTTISGTTYGSQQSFLTSGLSAPVATAATSVGTNSFTANWNAVTGATSYQLDVSASSTFFDVNATPLAGWNFESGTNTTTSGIAANNAKTITGNGGIATVTFNSGGNGGLTARATTWTNGNGVKYWEVSNIATTGYFNLTISSKQRSSGTGPRDFKLQYKIGAGGTYTDVSGAAIQLADNYTAGVLNNVALPAACYNQPSIYLRWIMTSNINVNAGTVADAGASNIDDIVIAGVQPSFLTGYNNLSVNGTSQLVSGLTSGATYYYRTRAVSANSTSANSNTISVTTCVPAAISGQPLATQTLCKDATPTNLTVTATGDGLTYQWYSNNSNSNSGGSPIGGATSAFYVPSTATAGTLYYYVVVTGTCATVTSNTAEVIVNAPPAISGQTSSTTVCQGQTPADLSVTATGAGLTYQWYSNDNNSNSGGTAIPGATSSTYTPSTTTAGTFYFYTVVSGTCTPAVTSEVQTVTVYSTPSVSTTAIVKCDAANADLNDGVTSNTSGLTVTFYSDAGLTNQISATVTSSGTYYVKVDNGHCTASASIDVTFSTSPTLTTQVLNKGCNVANTDLNDGITSSTSGLTATFYSDAAYTMSISNIVNAGGLYYVKVTNAAGCYATGSIQVIGDVIAPTITCPPSVTENLSTAGANPGCSRTVTLASPSFADDCGTPTLTWEFEGVTTGSGTGDIPASQLFTAGRTRINYTVTDASGNSTTCNSTVVTIVDDIFPTIVNPPATTTVGPDAGVCTATLNFPTITPADNCTVKAVLWVVGGVTAASGSWQPGDALTPVALNPGINRLKYTVTDFAGNSIFYNYDVSVVDNVAPTVTPPSDIVENLVSGCTKSIATNNPVYADNCSGIASVTWKMTGATYAVSKTTGINIVGTKDFNSGVTTITYSVKDKLGNIGTASFTVTVVDNITPTITCPTDIADDASATLCGKKILVPNAIVGDNCKVTLLTWVMTGATTLSSATTGVNQIGTKTFNTGVTTVTYTVGDAAGNTAQCGFTVTITDNTPPAMQCPSSKVYSITSGTDCFKSIAVSNPIITDNCGVASYSYTMSGATNGSGIGYVGTQNFNVGVTTITYTATDVNNKQNTCSFTVTVNDGLKPTINCGNPIVQTISGCSALVDVDAKSYNELCGTVVSLTWAMTGATVDASPSTGINQVGTHSFNVGVTTITYTVTDNSGNVGTCKQTVTLKETTKPVITCPAPSTFCQNGTGNYTVSPLSANDNCGIVSTSYSITGAITRTGTGNDASGSFNVGVSTIKWTVKDASGNSATCSSTVTVNSCTSRQAPLAQANEVHSTLKASLFPNPTNAQFQLQVKGNTKEAVEVSVYDAEGRKLESMKTIAGKTISFGESYFAGTYMIEVRQGNERVTVTGVKSNR